MQRILYKQSKSDAILFDVFPLYVTAAFNMTWTMGIMKLLWCAACITLAAGKEDFPILNQQTREVLFKQGEPLRIDCGVVETPAKKTNYTWHKDGKPLNLDKLHLIPEHNKHSLIFIEPTKKTQGQYQCFADSDFGIASSGIINVKQTHIEVPKIEPQRHIPKENYPYKLECPLPNSYPEPTVTWMYQHGLDSTISHTILDPRITIGPDGSLYFSSVTKEDASKDFKYVCLTNSPAEDKPVVLASHYITGVSENKNGPEKLVEQYLSSEKMTVYSGGVTSLYCIYGGTPVPSPDWFLASKDINGSGNERITSHNRTKGKRLLIRDTRVTDSGAYSCVVTDTDGKKKTHVINLTVLAHPTLVNKPEPKTTVKEGQDITIRCEVKSTPQASIKWTINSFPLVESSRVKSNTKPGIDSISSELLISKAEKIDQAYYGCKGVREDTNVDSVYAETLLVVA